MLFEKLGESGWWTAESNTGRGGSTDVGLLGGNVPLNWLAVSERQAEQTLTLVSLNSVIRVVASSRVI